MKKILIPIFALFLSASSWAGATFSRITTWSSGNTLTASALNSEFQNILNNLTPAGMDDYSANTTEMRTVTDPYPAAAESLATSLQGELERIRYQILEIKKAMQTSNVTYWYQDLPTAGVFTIAGSSVGVNDTTPDAAFDVEGSLNVSTNAAVGGMLTVAGSLSVSGNLSWTGGTKIWAYATGDQTNPNGKLTLDAELFDTKSEWSVTSSSFTATDTGYYLFTVQVQMLDDNAGNSRDWFLGLYNQTAGDHFLQQFQYDIAAGSNIPTPLTATCVQSLTAGDQVIVRVVPQTSATGIADSGSSITYLNILRVF